MDTDTLFYPADLSLSSELKAAEVETGQLQVALQRRIESDRVRTVIATKIPLRVDVVVKRGGAADAGR
jgi:hypothetical protein